MILKYVLAGVGVDVEMRYVWLFHVQSSGFVDVVLGI